MPYIRHKLAVVYESKDFSQHGSNYIKLHRHLSLVTIFSMNDMFKVCPHPANKSIHRLVDDFKEHMEAKYLSLKFCLK